MPVTRQVGTDRPESAGAQYNWGLGYLLLACTALGWGCNFPVMKLGLAQSPPLLYTALRMLLGVSTMLVIACLTGNLRLPHKRDWPVVLSVGVLQNMGFITLATLGLQYLPAGRAVILAYTTPIWVVPAAALFLGERLNLSKAIGVGLGLTGLLTIINPLSLELADSDVLTGIALIVCATLVWTAGLIHVRRHRWHGDVLSLIPWQIGMSVTALAPIALWLEDPADIQWSLSFGLNILFSGMVASGLCVAAQVAAMRSLPAVSLSLNSAAVPAVGILASFLILNEIPSVTDITGFFLIAAAIVLVGLADWRQARLERPAMRERAKPQDPTITKAT
ncbi:DMT family transporter [Marinobacter sp. R17]|uniref:DMT family transporter n=1 Tax=Marinobacter sp. R17 TaxID=2484250 RepID=UPI000F4B26CA|nr:DMT family transporter [Marinobacter sp. R17]ROU00064.1 DMT family transporter [Marinobacter sp. R17]